MDAALVARIADAEVDAIQQLDRPIVVAYLLLIVLIFILINFLVDFLYVVLDPGLTPFTLHELMTEEQYLDAQDEYGADSFTAKIGAEAIRDILLALDLEFAAIMAPLSRFTAARTLVMLRVSRVTRLVSRGRTCE